MLNKRFIIILLFCLLWLTGKSFAFFLATGEAIVYFNPDLSEDRIIYTLSQEVSSYDAVYDNNKFYIAFTNGEDLYFTYSSDNAQSFSGPSLISSKTNKPSLAIKDNLIAIAWEDLDGICYKKSEDGGMTFLDPQPIFITGETLSSPALIIDLSENIHLIFLSEENNSSLKKIYFSQLLTVEPTVIFESYENITNLKPKNLSQGLLVYWQTEYSQRYETLCSISLDQGQNFSGAKNLSFDKELLDLDISNSKLTAITHADFSTSSIPVMKQEIKLAPLATPVILETRDKLIFEYIGSLPYILNIDIAKTLDFTNPEKYYQYLASLTQEVSLPNELADGQYYVRINVFDGLSQSPFSQDVSFEIDTISPQILSLEAEKSANMVTLKGNISESPTWLTINNKSVSGESSFQEDFMLTDGINLFTFILTDEADNTSFLSKEVFYNAKIPEIKVLNPKDPDWFKPDSSIVIEAEVIDSNNKIEDGIEARVMINNMLLEDILIYDQQEKLLFGFILLPADLSDGQHSAKIILADGEGVFTINIDSAPPVSNQPLGKPFFANSQSALVIPVKDLGAGLDPAGTLIKISGISIEGTASLEGQSLTFTTNTPLAEGTYEVEVLARDQVGNLGEPIVLSLIIDNTLPEITLHGTYEAKTSKKEIMIKGQVIEANPDSITIYNNKKKLASFTLNGINFSKKVSLSSGNNEIMIEAVDQAGNKAYATINTFATSAAPSSNLIVNCLHGPNPFSPKKDLPGTYSTHGKGMVFSYALSQPANVKIHIFDITGVRIWTKEIKNTASGVTAWNGVGQFGNMSANGIYPYVFSANAGGRSEIQRGKILIFHQ